MAEYHVVHLTNARDWFLKTYSLINHIIREVVEMIFFGKKQRYLSWDEYNGLLKRLNQISEPTQRLIRGWTEWIWAMKR